MFKDMTDCNTSAIFAYNMWAKKRVFVACNMKQVVVIKASINKMKSSKTQPLILNDQEMHACASGLSFMPSTIPKMTQSCKSMQTKH